MRHFIRERMMGPMPMSISLGWGNGYVVLPKGHPMHGRGYDDIPVDVHGGLTFAQAVEDTGYEELGEEDAGGWIVGFDTAHWGDDQDTCDQDFVEEETVRLLEQLEKLSTE
jgi:hypothetical protein